MMVARWLMAVTTATVMLFASMAPAQADVVGDAVLKLQHEWAKVNYQMPEDRQEAAFKKLVGEASALAAKYPDRAEPKIWEAIIRAGYAGAMGGLSSMFKAMPEMKKGRDLLLAAEKINPDAMHGSIYTTLGSFYYMVPGGFIGYGDDDKAKAYLEKALKMAPDDMDANYFMGDFWLDQKRYRKAEPYFRKVLSLPDVPGRPVYSKGRKGEAQKKLTEVEKHIH
ncbi:MAG TPA: tetratricopeptide repeat protein [Mariprofundaceae bacterium]|nr:tetratricopeptide repeat protein [Mariprofundaceae bacterium]